MQHKRSAFIVGAIILSAVVLAGCTTQPDTTTTTPPATNTPTANPPATTRVGATATFTVNMSDFAFSTTEINVAPGQVVTINVTDSTGNHDFVIKEFGIDSGLMKSGQLKSFTFTVPSDALGKTYEFYCSVGTHRQMGMTGLIKVMAL